MATMMRSHWKPAAIRVLLSRRAGSSPSAWSYGSGSSPCAEPTALAVLGLLASAGDGALPPEVSDAARGAGSWLASLQRSDGSLGISATAAEPGWATAHASLAWRALGGYEAERTRAAAWLHRQAGATMPREDGPHPVNGHDPSIVGWPWVEGTHSWVEPTAMAVLALRREGMGGHARVEEGLRLLRDRAIITGGWNAGNKATYGRALRPYPATTGLALLALAGSGRRDAVVENAVKYLLATLPGVRAAESLGWGILGLRAWGRAPVDADRWLAESFERVASRVDAAPRLALLLLAAGGRSLELFDAR